MLERMDKLVGKTDTLDLPVLDAVLASLPPEERAEARQRFLRYLELVLIAVEEADGLTDPHGPRTLSLSL